MNWNRLLHIYLNPKPVKEIIVKNIETNEELSIKESEYLANWKNYEVVKKIKKKGKK